MADHDVSFTIPERELGEADIEFRVKRNGSAFGRLRVSEGSIVCPPTRNTATSWTGDGSTNLRKRDSSLHSE